MTEFQLQGRTALVTGASRGIGRAAALALARAGAHVAGVARSAAGLEALGQEVEATGRRFLALDADLLEPGAPERVAERAWAWRGRVDVLVNAAGVIVRSEVPEVTPQAWDLQFGLNVRAAFFLTQALGRRMLETGGSVVNVTSVAAEVATGAPTVYAATKAALGQMTRVLAVRWAPRVRVNAVGPSYVRTELNRAWLDDPGHRDWVLARTPLARFGTPEDVAGAIVFLASPAAAYVTGQHLLVDGGWTAQ